MPTKENPVLAQYRVSIAQLNARVFVDTAVEIGGLFEVKGKEIRFQLDAWGTRLMTTDSAEAQEFVDARSSEQLTNLAASYHGDFTDPNNKSTGRAACSFQMNFVHSYVQLTANTPRPRELSGKERMIRSTVLDALPPSNTRSDAEVLQELSTRHDSLVGQLTASLRESEALLRGIQAGKKRVEDLKARSATAFNNIESMRKQVDEAHAETSRRKPEVDSHAAKARSDSQEAAGARERVVASSDSIKELQDEIKERSRKNRERIDKLMAQAEAASESVLARKTDVEAVLGDATAAQLYVAFNKRKEELETTNRAWIQVITAVSILLSGASLALVWDLSSSEDAIGMMLLKVLSLLPLIALDWLLVRHYNSRARLIEQYAFKATVALSLKHYQKLVDDERDQNDEEALKFLLDTIGSIYAPPSTQTWLSPKDVDKFTRLLEKLGLATIKGGFGVGEKVIARRLGSSQLAEAAGDAPETETGQARASNSDSSSQSQTRA